MRVKDILRGQLTALLFEFFDKYLVAFLTSALDVVSQSAVFQVGATSITLCILGDKLVFDECIQFIEIDVG